MIIKRFETSATFMAIKGHNTPLESFGQLAWRPLKRALKNAWGFIVNFENKKPLPHRRAGIP